MIEATKQAFRDRFYGLGDYRLSFHNLHPSVPNPDKWLEDLLLGTVGNAETEISALETKHAELVADSKYLVAEWDSSISAALKEQGISERFLLYALVQHLRGDTSYFDSVKPTLDQLDLDYPRP